MAHLPWLLRPMVGAGEKLCLSLSSLTAWERGRGEVGAGPMETGSPGMGSGMRISRSKCDQIKAEIAVLSLASARSAFAPRRASGLCGGRRRAALHAGERSAGGRAASADRESIRLVVVSPPLLYPDGAAGGIPTEQRPYGHA